jgi:alpha-tubulin suppressor-like RCC1 family protein
MFKSQKGITLPVVLVFSLTIMAIMVVLLTVATASYKSLYVDHYQKIAEEAAEAGTAYATACLSISSHIQTWGSNASGGAKPDLAPNTDCAGANNYPTNLYVYSDSNVRTSFVAGNLDYSQPFTAQISSIGTAQVLKPDGSVAQTYTSTKKKVIVWPTDIGAQTSSSGTNRTCAIVNYAVYCWGYNGYGQLGNGQYIGGPAAVGTASSIDSLIPVKVVRDPGVMANKQIVKVFAAQYHSCALSSDGKMYCWGYNGQGQLGTGDTTDSPVPVQVGGALAGQVVTDIGGTANTTCAITNSKIYCWGQNDRGQVGLNYANSTSVLTPTPVVAGNTTSTLATSYVATGLSSGSRSKLMCAIADNRAYCWGPNESGGIGDNTTVQKNLPTKVLETGGMSGKNVTSISQDGKGDSSQTGGYAHACAVAEGVLYCWGENATGQIGDGTTTDRYTPVAITTGALSGKTVQTVQVGLGHSCVKASNGAYCWGSNGAGQVGDSSKTQRLAPVAVTTSPGALTSSNVVSVGGGGNRGCAVITDGRTFCWGLNDTGQIGDGTTIDRTSPTESLFLRPFGNQYIF